MKDERDIVDTYATGNEFDSLVENSMTTLAMSYIEKLLTNIDGLQIIEYDSNDLRTARYALRHVLKILNGHKYELPNL